MDIENDNEYKLILSYKDNQKIIESFYNHEGLAEFFENDNNYLKNSFDKIRDLWLDNFSRIEKINYLMIAEAALWGSDEKYIYNPKTNNSQFFHKSDLEVTLNVKIKNKTEFINLCNSIGLIILDISPFALNPNDTKINYRTIGKTQYREIVSSTLSNYFEEKVNLIKNKNIKRCKSFFPI